MSYSKSAAFYDAIFAQKDYALEARTIDALIQRHKIAVGNRLLDIACGTGGHVGHLRDLYQMVGVDLNEQMLEIARSRHPGIPFHQGDMASFDLGSRYDAAICLFSAVGYMTTVERLHQAIANMARHLEPGGVLIVEPWANATEYAPDQLYARFVDRPDLKLARMAQSWINGSVQSVEVQFLINDPSGIHHFTETHEFGLFSAEEYAHAFEAAGLSVHHDPIGLIGRGLYIGVKL